jgi:hypothetical protein
MLYVKNPIDRSYKEIADDFKTATSANGYEKIRDELQVKATIDIHNRNVTIGVIQITVSVILVITTLLLLNATYSLRGTTKMLNKMMPEMMKIR